MKEHIYKTQGTCAKAIRVVLNDDNTISEVQFAGGCMGNTAGVAALVKGMSANEAMSRLRGIQCGGKGTSCPDQLSKALEEII